MNVQPQPIPSLETPVVARSWQFPRTSLSDIWSSFKRHSDLVTSVNIFGLNTMVLASKATTFVPDVGGRVAQVALGYVGVGSIPAQAHYLGKTWYDLTQAVEGHDWSSIAAMATKVANEVTNILLTGIGFGATLLTLSGYRSGALKIYRITAPWGLAGTIASVALDIYQAAHNYRVGLALDRLSDDQTTAVFEAISEGRHQKDHLPSRIMQSLDPDTLQSLDKELAEESQPAAHHREVVRDYVRKQNEYARASLGLRALGYGSMAVCRANPDTLLSSAVLWGMSALYTSKLVAEKVTRWRTQEKLNQR